MSYFIPEHSFIATIKCQTPGWEGYLDNAEIQTREEGGQRVGYRKQTTWLTVNNFAPDNPHKFWFRMMAEGKNDPKPYYEIHSAEPHWLPSFERKDAVLGEKWTGSMGFYEEGSKDTYLFCLQDAGGSNLGGTFDTGKRRGVLFRNAGDPYGTLTVANRHDDWQYWYGYVIDGIRGKYSPAELIADVNVLRMGVAHL